MSCQFKDECPSYSGWCELPKDDFSRCIPFLITAIYTRDETIKDLQNQLKAKDELIEFNTKGRLIDKLSMTKASDEIHREMIEFAEEIDKQRNTILCSLSLISAELQKRMDIIRADLSRPIMKGVIEYVNEEQMDQNNIGQSS